MASLPLDVLADIAIHLDSEDLLAAAAVCKTWREVITTTRRLWQHPHFFFTEPPAFSQLPFHPPPTLIAGYRGTLPLLSLHLSGYGERSWYPHLLDTTSLSDLVASLENLLVKTGKFSDDVPSIHLILDSMSTAHLAEAAGFLANIIDIPRLSVRTRPESYQSAAVLGLLIHKTPSSKPWETVEIYTSLAAYPSNWSRRITARSISPEADNDAALINSYYDVNWQVFARFGVRVQSLSLQLPESLQSSWLSHRRPVLVLDNFKQCVISGGAWHIKHPQVDSVIEHLSLTDLWGFSWTPREADNDFRKLVSIKVCFAMTTSPVKWEDIADFLYYTLVEHIEVIHLELPSNQGQNMGVNVAFNVQISKCHNLRELTLARYIPSTLKGIFKDEVVCTIIQKLVLANAQLPVWFFQDFYPEILPNLELLDVSKAHPYRGSPPSHRRAWVEGWQKAGIADFREPEEC